MQLRCKEGDLAIIIKEEPGCEANIGRIVRVTGPIVMRENLGATWLITPVAGAPWHVILSACEGRSAVVIARTLSQLQRIEHPDRWMVPLEDDSAPDFDEQTVTISRPTAASVDEAVCSTRGIDWLAAMGQSA